MLSVGAAAQIAGMGEAATVPLLLPGDLKKALSLLRAEPGRGWTIDTLAALCGIGRRTLHKHFQRFVGRPPLAYLRKLRLEEARRQLLRAAPGANVAGIASDCGFTHLGRFATWYRGHYGESASATLRRHRHKIADEPPRLQRSPSRIAESFQNLARYTGEGRRRFRAPNDIHRIRERKRWHQRASGEAHH